MTSVITKNSSNTALRSRAYTYDDASRIATQTVESVTTTYGYDNADQLTSESRSGYVASYTYDGNGNRLTKTLNSVTDAYSYDDGDKLLAITRGGNEYKDYTYDACGRTATISDENTTQTFSYDYEDRVTQISGLATTNTFAYNGLDTRVKMVNSLGTSQFQRCGAGVTEPVVADGAATYTPGVSERRSGVTAYLHSGLKDADAQSGSSQTVVASRTYDAFGAVVSSSGTWKGPFGYAGSFGYQEDADSGYQLLGHRYYDPSTGRFLTRDPVKDGRNWYAYCSSSPTFYADSNGLDPFRLPQNPSGLPPGWWQDEGHGKPGVPPELQDNQRWYPEEGKDGLEWGRGTPGKPGWGGKDHWHRLRPGVNGRPVKEDPHLEPGDMVDLEFQYDPLPLRAPVFDFPDLRGQVLEGLPAGLVISGVVVVGLIIIAVTCPEAIPFVGAAAL